MKYFYSLRIYVPNGKDVSIESIKKALGIDIDDKFQWQHEITLEKQSFEFEVIQKEEDIYFNFIDYFLNLIDYSGSKLQKFGIKKSDISIWMLYEYDTQCNMEFNPKLLKRLGVNDITFCISCWEK